MKGRGRRAEDFPIHGKVLVDVVKKNLYTSEVPTVFSTYEEVIQERLYSNVHENSFVISGPLGRSRKDQKGRGRWFETVEQAIAWARSTGRYRFIQRVREAEIGQRWALRVILANVKPATGG